MTGPEHLTASLPARMTVYTDRRAGGLTPLRQSPYGPANGVLHWPNGSFAIYTVVQYPRAP